MYPLLVCFFLSLASLQQTSATRPQGYLHDETQQTLQALQSLPSHCSQGIDSLVVAEQRKLPAQVFYCSITSIAIDLAEIGVDTVYFGIEAYVAVPAFLRGLKGLKTCLDETTAEAKLTCALEYLTSTVQAARVIVAGVENYFGEMKMIVPLVVEQIEQCTSSSSSQYRAFLESVVSQATTCAQ